YPTGRVVSLPGYPWERERHWNESRRGAIERLNGSRHPLLGIRLDAPNPTWEREFDLRRDAYIADHRVQGQVVMPGAVYPCMALAAALALRPDTPTVLEDVEFQRPLVFAAGQPQAVQLTVSPSEGAFALHSAGSSPETPWTRHAVGRLRPCAEHEPGDMTVDLEALRNACPRSRATADLY